ncbi:MAG TPA: hypothetical protein VGZ32_01410 [Actinocrinis sp.]|uniref:hypothetical protein n=1 Tax=Actinocrinis sp. TaxID=1920516 RepID=UPI002DDCE2D7|nr:hypothetical protein [Actinocrinis sp.]HEV3168962.1 hypothetical protein [Actinocrinis sp.]
MSFIRTTVVAATVAGAAVLSAASAGAATSSHSPAPSHGARPYKGDGCPFTDFCASNDNVVYETAGNSSAWPSWIANQQIFVDNEGDPNAGPADVDIFYDTAAQGYGAYACMTPGTFWFQGDGNTYIFSWQGYHGSDGLGDGFWNNAVAHHWVYGPCGNYNDSGF